MWFRNLLIYRFSQPVPFSEYQLIEALEQKPSRPCASQETHTLGWTTPWGRHSENRVEVSNGYWLIAMRKEERILPGSVVKEALAEKVEEIENRDARKVYKKERDTLKDEIVMSLLPRAFTRTQTTFACLIAHRIGIEPGHRIFQIAEPGRLGQAEPHVQYHHGGDTDDRTGQNDKEHEAPRTKNNGRRLTSLRPPSKSFLNNVH